MGIEESDRSIVRNTAVLETVFKALPNLVFLIGPDNEYLDYWASEAAPLLIPPSRFLGRRVDEVLPPDAAAVILASILRARAEQCQQSATYSLPLPGGEQFFEAQIMPIEDGCIASLVTNVTERKKAQDLLQRSEERYRTIVETTHEGIWTIDAEGTTTFVNRRMAQMLGVPAGEMAGRSVFDFLDAEGREYAKRYLEQRDHGTREESLLKLLRADGSDLWIAAVANPLYDESGAHAGALAMVTDLTERRRLEDQLHQAQKLESLGRLAGGVAHDFNNLLTAILGYAEMAEDEAEPNSSLADCLSRIRLAGERAASLTSQLLAFARKQTIAPSEFDLNDLMLEIDRLLGRLLTENIERALILGNSALHVRADATQIQQIVMNLALNARDAMPEGGRLTIEAGLASSGDAVMLSVSDTGVGMSREVMGHIFEPFFTTKGMGRGTGLGLATVYGIVNQNGWRIGVSSDLGTGTVFTVTMPGVEVVHKPTPEPPPVQLATGAGTVLLAEDEAAVRELMAHTLRLHGYDILEAANGLEALAVARQNSGDIRLLITDLVMPHMGGKQLAETLAAECRGIKVIMVSGYNDSTVEDGVRFLRKPFSRADLLRAVQEAAGDA